MSMIINTTNDILQADEFDRTLVGGLDQTGQLYTYLDGVSFTDSSKKLLYGAQDAQVNDQVYIPNIDVFNALAVSVDLDLVVIPELVRKYDANYFSILYYTVSIDYNPLGASVYARQFTNIILNLWTGLNSDISFVYQVGSKFMDWQYFNLNSQVVNCILWTAPSARKINNDRSKYIRQTLDLTFMVMLDRNVYVCGAKN